MSNTREAAKRAVANMNAARNFPVGTCPASRHVALMAETLAKRKTYYMLTQEPDHCAESMATIVGALWECRAERNALAEENERLRKRVEAADSLARHLYTIGLIEGLDCDTGPLLDAYRAAIRKGGE